MTDSGVSAPLAARAALNDGGKGSWIAGEDPFVVALRPVLAAAGKAARISYAGLCQTDDGNSLRIPQDNDRKFLQRDPANQNFASNVEPA